MRTVAIVAALAIVGLVAPAAAQPFLPGTVGTYPLATAIGSPVQRTSLAHSLQLPNLSRLAQGTISIGAFCCRITCRSCLAHAQGFGPLGDLRTTDQDGPYNISLLGTQIAEIQGTLCGCLRSCCPPGLQLLLPASGTLSDLKM